MNRERIIFIPLITLTYSKNKFLLIIAIKTKFISVFYGINIYGINIAVLLKVFSI